MFYFYLGDSPGVCSPALAQGGVASSRERVVEMIIVWEHQADCENIPCVFGTCGVSPGAGSGRELQIGQVSSSAWLHQCNSACDLKSLGIKVPWNLQLHEQFIKPSCWSFSS